MRAVHCIVLALVTCACEAVHVDLSGRPCTDEDRCASGFECHPVSRTCVPTLARGCDGDGVCWSEVQTGEPCAPPGSFVPCGPTSTCVAGCRTCEESGWSDCVVEACEEDRDFDGICDALDTCVDDDRDGLGTGNLDNSGCVIPEVDADDSRASECADTDADGCDDCTSTVFNPAADGADNDNDGACDASDNDDDNDGVVDEEDTAPLDSWRCRDLDLDGCDDCSQGLPPDPANDGSDTDGDGICNPGDADDDNDGVDDTEDPATLDPDLCGDTDGDQCDDCALGVDDFGPEPDRHPERDGTDADSDGYCAVSDCRDDLPTANPAVTEGPVGATRCTDGIDNDCDGAIDAVDHDCWLDPSWTRRKQLVVQSARVSGNHAHFPVLVACSDADLRQSARADGGDILFTADDGATVLPHELEWFDPTTGELAAWVLVANVSDTTDTRLYMYYGSSTVATQDAAAVWDDDFVGVWHLNDNPEAAAPQIRDSNDGQKTMDALGGMTASDNVPGKVGRGLDLDGTNDVLRTPDLTAGFSSSTVTIEVWFLARGDGVVIDELGQAAPNSGWHDSQIEILHTGAVLARVWATSAVSLGQVSFDAWHQAVLRYDAATRTLDGFLDGVEAVTDVTDDRIVPYVWDSDLQQRWAIGPADSTDLGSGAQLDGAADELRISRVARTDEWIETGFRNQDDPSGFVSVGAEEIY